MALQAVQMLELREELEHEKAPRGEKNECCDAERTNARKPGGSTFCGKLAYVIKPCRSDNREQDESGNWNVEKKERVGHGIESVLLSFSVCA